MNMGVVASYWILASAAGFIVCFLIGFVAMVRQIPDINDALRKRIGGKAPIFRLWPRANDWNSIPTRLAIFNEQRKSRNGKIAMMALIGCAACMGSIFVATGLSQHYGWLPQGSSPNSLRFELKGFPL